MRGEPDTLTTSPAPRSMRLLVAGALATVVVGFVVGFALGGRGPDDSGDPVTAADSSTSLSTTTSSTVAPAASEPPTTAAAPSSTTSPPTTEAPVTTTEASPTTVATVPTTVVTRAPAPTTAPPTFAPSRVVVSYATDGSGRLVVRRSGSATLVITNEGGLAQQWLVTGTGFTTMGATQGSLAPGQTVTVTIVAPRAELPLGEVSGIISVLGAINPTVAFVIPAA